MLFEQARIQKGGAFSPSFIGTSNQKHLEIQGAKLAAFRAQLRLCQAQLSLSELASLRPLSQHPPSQDGFPPACLASSCLSSIIHPSNFLLPLNSSEWLNFLFLPHGKLLPCRLSGPRGWPCCREAFGEGGIHGKQEACSHLPTGHCPWNVLQEPPPPNI